MSDYLDASRAGFTIDTGGACCCLYLKDTFYRTAGNIAPDGVNLRNAITNVPYTRYTFTGTDWIVGTGTGRLLCQTAASPIYWYNDPSHGAYLNALVTATLYDDTDTLTVSAGAVQAKISFPADDTIKIEFVGGESWEKTYASPITFPLSGTFGIKIVDADYYEEKEPGICNSYAVDALHIVGTLNPFSTGCAVQLGTYAKDDFDEYAIEATAGVTVENIGVGHARPDCAAVIGAHCSKSCYPDPIPNTVTVNVGGYTRPKWECVDQPAVDACWDKIYAECAACLAVPLTDCYDPGHPCNQDYCTRCYIPNATCKNGCNCAAANGAYILTKVASTGDYTCQCRYRGVFAFSSDGGPPTINQAPCTDSEPFADTLATAGLTGFFLVFEVEYIIVFYDCDTGELQYSMYWVSNPFGDPSLDGSEHLVSDYCAGDELTYTGANGAAIDVRCKNGSDELVPCPVGCDCLGSESFLGPCPFELVPGCSTGRDVPTITFTLTS